MFDVVGKRRWFYAFSLLITIPGFIFILLTPLTGGKDGLQFTIDYTGGTIWEFRPASPADPLVVQAAVASAGHEEATVTEAGCLEVGRDRPARRSVVVDEDRRGSAPGERLDAEGMADRQIGIARYYSASATYGWYWTTDFSTTNDGTNLGGGGSSPTATCGWRT